MLRTKFYEECKDIRWNGMSHEDYKATVPFLFNGLISENERLSNIIDLLLTQMKRETETLEACVKYSRILTRLYEGNNLKLTPPNEQEAV